VEIAQRLAESGIGIGAGNFYAYRLVQALGYDPEAGVLRASFVHYTSNRELELFLSALDDALAPRG
jgi:selenocysteine lyase/cysteine desulfurase